METWHIGLSFLVLGLLLGGVLGLLFTPDKYNLSDAKNKLENKILENEHLLVKLANLENQLLTKPIKEIEFIEKETVKDYLTEAKEAYLEELADYLDRYQELGKITLSDDYKVKFTEDGYSTEFEITYRLLDTLTDTRTTVTEKVRVTFEDDEVTFKIL